MIKQYGSCRILRTNHISPGCIPWINVFFCWTAWELYMISNIMMPSIPFMYDIWNDISLLRHVGVWVHGVWRQKTIKLIKPHFSTPSCLMCCFTMCQSQLTSVSAMPFTPKRAAHRASWHAWAQRIRAYMVQSQIEIYNRWLNSKQPMVLTWCYSYLKVVDNS